MALFRKRSEPVAKQAAEPSNFAELANRGLYKANGSGPTSSCPVCGTAGVLPSFTARCS